MTDLRRDRASAALRGLRAAAGVPGLILGASFVGFGSMVHGAGLDLLTAILATGSIWALPGQIALIELYALGAPFFVIVLGVGLTNARLLPMVVTLLPWLRRSDVAPWKLYLAAHVIAVTSWANAMRELPQQPEAVRLAWFGGFAGGLWSITLGATAAGFLLAGSVPGTLTLALVFLNPLYFLLLLLDDLTQRPKLAAVALGGVAGPLFHLVSPDWALPLTGLFAGTAAFLLAGRGPPPPPQAEGRASEAGDD